MGINFRRIGLNGVKYFFVTIVAAVILASSSASAEMYTFGGDVICGVNNETVLVRYVYTFEGVIPHEGRVYCTTDANGHYEFDRDITNIWGSGPLLSVVAWAWARDDEKYIENVTPVTPNYFDDFVFVCGKPIDIHPHELGAAASSDSLGSDMSWGRVKALFR